MTAARPQLASARAGLAPRRLTVNFLVLSAGEVVVKLLTLAAFTFMARTLGPARYGSVEFVVAVMAFFTLFSEWGLGDYGAREVARNPGLSATIVHELAWLRVALAAGAVAGVFLFMALVGKQGDWGPLLAVYALSLLTSPFLLHWFFQGHDRMQWVAAAQVTRQVIFSGSVLLLLRAGTPLVAVGLMECAALAATGLLLVYAVRTRFGFTILSERPRPAVLFAHLWQSFPIGVSSLCWAFLWYFATVLLGLQTADRTLGWYGASHRATLAIHTFVWLYFFNLLPSISRCKNQPLESLTKLLAGSIRVAAWLGILGAFFLSALSAELFTLAYGPSFTGGAGLFALLVWMVPVAMLSAHYRYTLIGYNLQQWLAYCALATAVAAAALGFVFIRRFGAVGAASTLLIANILDFALAYWCVRKFVTRVRFSIHLVMPLVALALAVGCFLVLKPYGAWPAGLGASALYAAVLLACEWRRIPKLWALLLGNNGGPAV